MTNRKRHDLKLFAKCCFKLPMIIEYKYTISCICQETHLRDISKYDDQNTCSHYYGIPDRFHVFGPKRQKKPPTRY